MRVERRDARVEVMEQGFVEAFAALAQRARRCQLARRGILGRCVRDAGADALATRLVVQPEHREPRALQQVEQVLRVVGSFHSMADIERKDIEKRIKIVCYF